MEINRPKILAFFTPFLNGGGAEKVLINLLDEFQKKGINTDLCLVNKTGELVSEIPKNTNVVNFNKSRTILSIYQLIKYLKSEVPHTLLTIGDEANLIALLSKILFKFRTKIIITSHHVNSYLYYKNLTIKKIIMLLLIKLLYKYADNIIAVSKGVSKDLKQILNNSVNIKMIYNPIKIKEINDLSNESINHPWLLDNKFPLIISIGRLTKDKDFSNLIKAFSILRKNIFAKLIIIGDGEEKSNLINLIRNLNIQNDVEIIKYTLNPYNYLKYASVFVCSSSNEGFSLVIVEALALGISVVSTNCQYGPPEILNYGEYGTLVPLNDPNKLSQAIYKTITNPMDKSKLIKRSNDFSSDIIAMKYLEVIYE